MASVVILFNLKETCEHVMMENVVEKYLKQIYLSTCKKCVVCVYNFWDTYGMDIH